jgi:hypothetical protein
LRWGRTDGGKLFLNEARYYIAGQAQRDMMPHWEQLWSYPQWTKIKIFKWLVLHKKKLDLGKPCKKSISQTLKMSPL